MTRSVRVSLFLALVFTGASLHADKAPAEKEMPLIKPEADVIYRPFYPDRWKKAGLEPSMTAWMGKNLCFLTLDPNLDPKMVSAVVHKMDQGWGTYDKLIGPDPRPFRQHKGKPTIASVPDPSFTCGGGCGYVGASGIELALLQQRDWAKLKKNPNAVPHYIFYEMGRNFYVFGERHSHFATGFAVFMRYVCMDATKSVDVEAHDRVKIEAVEAQASKPTNPLTFHEMFIHDGQAARNKHSRAHGLANSHNTMYASVMLHLRKTYGGDAWVKRFYAALETAKPFHIRNVPNSAYRQSLNWIVCASIASGEDLAPLFIKRYKFLMSEKDQATLAEIDWKKKDLKVAEIVRQLASKAP